MYCRIRLKIHTTNLVDLKLVEVFDGECDREIDSTYFNGGLDDNINIIESYILSTQSICPPL